MMTNALKFNTFQQNGNVSMVLVSQWMLI